MHHKKPGIKFPGFGDSVSGSEKISLLNVNALRWFRTNAKSVSLIGAVLPGNAFECLQNGGEFNIDFKQSKVCRKIIFQRFGVDIVAYWGETFASYLKCRVMELAGVH